MASLGDMAYNARKLAQRRVDAMKLAIKSGFYSASEVGQMKASIKQLQKEIRATRMKTKTGKIIKSHTEQERMNAINRLQELSKAQQTLREAKKQIKQLKQNIFRENKITQQQLNLASLKSTQELEKVGSQVGRYTNEQVKRFYQATQKYWEDAKEKDRNDAILRGLGMKSLADAVDFVLTSTSEQAKLVKDIRENNLSYDDMTDEQKAMYNEMAKGDKGDELKPSEEYQKSLEEAISKRR